MKARRHRLARAAATPNWASLSNGSIYFCDLTLANFSVARSDDLGATFPCSNTGVPDAVVDRQWYAFDGDPLNGGSIYLTNDEVAQSPTDCGGSVTNFGQNIMVMYRSPVTSNAATTAGLLFGPANKVSNPMGCDEGIMGNDEVSPIATTLGQPRRNGRLHHVAIAGKARLCCPR